MTYKNEIYAIFEERPDADRHEIAEEVGCAPDTVSHYRTKWRREQGSHWAYPPAIEATTCEKCPYAKICHEMDKFTMPLLCQSVPHPEKRRLEAIGALEDFEAVRAYVIEQERQSNGR